MSSAIPTVNNRISRGAIVVSPSWCSSLRDLLSTDAIDTERLTVEQINTLQDTIKVLGDEPETGAWVTCTYEGEGVEVWATEIEALRSAVLGRCTAVWVPSGSTVREALKDDGQS